MMPPMPRLSSTCLNRVWPLTVTAILLFNGFGLAQPDTSGACSQTGSPRVAALEFQGLKTTRSEVVRRELRNRVGQPFSCDSWIAEQSRLEDLDIFADVRLRVVPKDAPGDTSGGPPEKSEVVLTYVFRELPPYIPFVAVSKTEQDGLSLGPALASLNFLGQGIRAEFITRFGGTTEVQASLSSPRMWNLPLKYDLAVLRVDSYNNFEAFHEDSWRAKLDLAQGLGEAGLPEPAYILYAGELFWMRAGDRGREGDTADPSGISSASYWTKKGISSLVWAPASCGTAGTGVIIRAADCTRRYSSPRTAAFWAGPPITGNGFRIRAPTCPCIRAIPWHCQDFINSGTGLRAKASGGTIGSTWAGSIPCAGIPTTRSGAKAKCIFTVENRMDWIRKRTLSLWRWSAHYGLQGILGWEAASLWDHNALLERDFHSAGFVGVHLLIAGADRIRFEAGSKFAKFQFEADIGIFDKADVQRFRAR